MIDISKMLRSFLPAIHGLKLLLTENNFRVHLLAFVCVIVAGFFVGVNNTEWAILIICVALVLVAEAVNSAIESVVDLATDQIHPLAKKAKDIAAAAVLIAATFAVIIAVLILSKYFI